MPDDSNIPEAPPIGTNVKYSPIGNRNLDSVGKVTGHSILPGSVYIDGTGKSGLIRYPGEYEVEK